MGLGVASFFGYVNFMSRLYRVKERNHRNEGKDDPFLEYCKTCRVNVAAKKYVGEDNWQLARTLVQGKAVGLHLVIIADD